MKIAIIGKGNMANAITSNLSKNEEIVIYGKDEEEAKSLAEKYGQTSKKLEDNVEEEFVILAVPYDSILDVFKENPNSLKNKVLIDISNAMNWQTLELREGEGALKTVESLPEGSSLIKAFNTIPAAILEKGEIDGKPVDVFLAGDDEEAKKKLAEAIDNSGLRAIDIGPLSHAYHAEVILMVNSLAGKYLGSAVSTKILS